ADRWELGRPEPHSRQAGPALGTDADIRERQDQHPLQIAQVAVGVTARRFQLDDGISDELARTMVGDVSPAPGLADGVPLPFELLPSNQEVALARCPAESDDRIVLEQDEGVLDELLATR